MAMGVCRNCQGAGCLHLSSLVVVVAGSRRLHLAPENDQCSCTGAALSALVKGICLLLTVFFSPC